MKTAAKAFLAVGAIAMAGPVFAGRDEAQWQQHWRALEQVKATRAAQSDRGLAGPIGVRGKVGPASALHTGKGGDPNRR